MKKLLKSLLSLMMIVSSLYPITISAVNNVLEGAGTSENPWMIADAEDFVTMASLIDSDSAYADDYYQMTKDVDFSNVSMSKIGKKCL